MASKNTDKLTLNVVSDGIKDTELRIKLVTDSALIPSQHGSTQLNPGLGVPHSHPVPNFI